MRVHNLVWAAVLMLAGCDVSRQEIQSDKYLYRSVTLDMPLRDAITAIQKNDFDCGRNSRRIDIDPVTKKSARILADVPGWVGETILFLVNMRELPDGKTTSFLGYANRNALYDGTPAIDTMLEIISIPNRPC